MDGHCTTSHFICCRPAHSCLATPASLLLIEFARKAHGRGSWHVWFPVSGIIFLRISACCSLKSFKALLKYYFVSQTFPGHSLYNTPHLLSVLYFWWYSTFHLCHFGNSFIAMPASKSTNRQAPLERFTNLTNMIESHGLLNQLKLTLGE